MLKLVYSVDVFVLVVIVVMNWLCFVLSVVVVFSSKVCCVLGLSVV